MIDSSAQQAFQLLWDTDHFTLYDLEETDDLDFSPYVGYDQSLIYQTAEFKIPAQLIYSGYLPTIKSIDYPLTDNRWTVMSQRMYKTLLGVGDFPHRALPTVIVDTELPEQERRILSDKHGELLLRPEAVINDYVTVQLTEHEDLFDWERSRFTRPSKHLPNLLAVSQYVLKIPEENNSNSDSNGLPPLFRLKADPTVLFISAAARRALKSVGITGPRYLSLSGYQDGNGDAIDVPVVLETEFSPES